VLLAVLSYMLLELLRATLPATLLAALSHFLPDVLPDVLPDAPLSRRTTRAVVQVAEVARGVVRPPTPFSCLKRASRTVSELRAGRC